MWPFNANIAKNKWVLIQSEGFTKSVPGCVYDGHQLNGGVPLGGLGTGYFTIEGNGKIGCCSIYNDIVPPRRDFNEWLELRVDKSWLPLSLTDIAYWGHYPVVDMVARFKEKPFTVGIRAFTPFIPGDAVDSNIPAALFDVRIQNNSDKPVHVELLISPPQPPVGKSSQVAMLGHGFNLSTEKDKVFVTASLMILPGESRPVRFVFAWYFPKWRDNTREAHVHQYSRRYRDAEMVARDCLNRFEELLSRVLSWQQEIYGSDLPDWLKDALIQGFYSFAKNSVWIARTRRDEWWSENGWFVHSESHSGCPIPETMVCRIHGHFPTLFFFPELEITTLDAFRHFQIADGEIPFSFGLNYTNMRCPTYHCQHPLNSGQYTQMIYRLFVRTGDHNLLNHFYDSAKRAIRYQYSLDDDDDGLLNDQPHAPKGEYWPANQFYDNWPWYGTSAYVAGTWLATLTCGKALARAMDDDEFASECEERLRKGQQTYEEKLWTGSYYRLWNDPAGGQRADVSLGNQLMGQWCVKVIGLGNLLSEGNVQKALDTIKRLNMSATAYGLVNAITPQGDSPEVLGPDIPIVKYMSKGMFVGETLCAAMTFMYYNYHETGMEIAQRVYETISLKSCSPWNQRCLISAETGLPVWGDDYYSNMIIWAVPMALAGQDIGTFCAQGGFVDRIIKAAK